MSNRYELALIVNTQAPDNAVDDIVARFDRLVSEGGGRSVEVDRWGARKLAYDIGRQQRGDYTFIRFEAPTEVLPEVDRMFKLDESVLRHMVVVDDSPVEEEPEAVEAEASGGGEDAQENAEAGDDKEEGE